MSFSPNKNLELVARGAEVGTWDTPTNSNWSIVDNSFGGVATVALTNSNVTLSAAQYQCNFLTFTGAISANIAITLPAVGSYYTVQNLTSNTSAFYITMTTTAGGQSIGVPPGEPVEIMTDGTNVKFRSLGRVGTYWDYAGSSVPAWVSICSVPPYLNCDGTSFSSGTYPVLSTILGGTTLPDSKGRLRASLNQGSARITSGTSTGGVDGNTLLSAGGDQVTTLSSQNMPPLPLTDPGHTHTFPTHDGSGATAGQMPLGWFSGTGTGSATYTGMSTVVTGITGGSSSPTNISRLPPLYIGGITMIRAA